MTSVTSVICGASAINDNIVCASPLLCGLSAGTGHHTTDGHSIAGYGTSKAGHGTSKAGYGTSKAGHGTSKAGCGTSKAGLRASTQ